MSTCGARVKISPQTYPRWTCQIIMCILDPRCYSTLSNPFFYYVMKLFMSSVCSKLSTKTSPYPRISLSIKTIYNVGRSYRREMFTGADEDHKPVC